MSRTAGQRLDDVLAAIEAIRSHLSRGGLEDGLVFDAVRLRLIEIGEAVKALPSDLRDAEPSVPWSQVGRMRDHLAHRYFDTLHGLVAGTVANDLAVLHGAIQRLRQRIGDDSETAPRD